MDNSAWLVPFKEPSGLSEGNLRKCVLQSVCVTSESASTTWWDLCASLNRGPISALLGDMQVLGGSPPIFPCTGNSADNEKSCDPQPPGVCSLPVLHIGSRGSNKYFVHQRKEPVLSFTSELGNFANTGSCLGCRLFPSANGSFLGWMGGWSFFSFFRVRSSHSESFPLRFCIF